jgi:lantibiotic modifying enzyme
MNPEAVGPLEPHPSVARRAPHWQPLLDGPTAERVRRVITEIATAMTADPAHIASPSLQGGAAGRALFFAYLAQSLEDDHYADLAEQFLDRTTDLLASAELEWGLYRGLTGVAWVVDHIAGGRADPELPDASSALDESWRLRLAQRANAWQHDLIGGLAGQAVYALERLPSAIAADGLGIIVDRLADGAVLRSDGISWLTRPDALSPPTRAEHPHGYYDLGVAHGVPAVIAVLAAARAYGVRKAQAEALYEGAVHWLMAQRLDSTSPSAFPDSVRDGATPAAARAAWCSGDPGVALTLFTAARAVGDPTLQREALRIARRAARRPTVGCGVVDAGLCHGAAGLAHIYNRFWQASGEPIFAEAARRWIDDALAWQQPGVGVAGFAAFSDSKLLGEADRSLLTGVEGIGLALAAAVSDVEPAWDRALMASLADS